MKCDRHMTSMPHKMYYNITFTLTLQTEYSENTTDGLDPALAAKQLVIPTERPSLPLLSESHSLLF